MRLCLQAGSNVYNCVHAGGHGHWIVLFKYHSLIAINGNINLSRHFCFLFLSAYRFPLNSNAHSLHLQVNADFRVFHPLQRYLYLVSSRPSVYGVLYRTATTSLSFLLRFLIGINKL